jgi:imidazolonepropionase
MNNKQWDAVWLNATIATVDELGTIENGAMATLNGKIAWLGKMDQLDTLSDQIPQHDLQGRLITPGLIDCHTHVVYAGDRSEEFQMRLMGASYTDIAKKGGGIQSTVRATRSASEEQLLEQSLPRIRSLMASGVTTIEIKSGYGLDLETELKILRVALQIEKKLPITVKKTFLGAHTIPLEYREKPEEYVDLICSEMIPGVVAENLADAIDVFCENIGFDLQSTERIFQAAQKYGLNIHVHAEQLSQLGGAALGARYQALSADHLEFLSESGVKALAESNTVAVLLPGAFYFLREKKLPPIDLFRKYKVPIAIASDCNPGTSPVGSILLMLNMGCVLFDMTPEEALWGVTVNAAKALGIEAECGSLAVGKKADFLVWNLKSPVSLCYYMGFNALESFVKGGELIYVNSI